MVYFKPTCVFNKDGTMRQFGIGYRNKTIIPIWLVVIIMAYLSYLFLLYLNTYTHISFKILFHLKYYFILVLGVLFFFSINYL